MVGQEPRGYREGLPPAGDLHRLEVEGGRYAGPEERRDLAAGRCSKAAESPPFAPRPGPQGR